AVAAGAQAVVTSSSPDKLEHARELGAAGGFNYRAPDWHSAIRDAFGPVALVVDGSGGEAWNVLPDLLDFGGRIVNYGATAGMPPRIDLFKIFWKQLRILGSTMGSPTDFAAMLGFVSRHQLRPVIDCVMPLTEVNEALQRMEQSTHMGKIVLDPTDSVL
ncbi:MAG TPA: zinc-binding dehydrogenase, partial [Pirellulaceae bacterium]